MVAHKFVVWFKDVGKEDVAFVGGKGANLGEMTQAGFPVPNGFIVTAKAYYEFLKENNLEQKIKHVLESVDYNNQKSLEKASKTIKKFITQGKLSERLVTDIFSAYKKLGGVLTNALVAVRSSATAEDLPTASFAGQQETYLNVQGEATLLLKIKQAWASLFGERALFYRHEQKFDHFKVGIALPVQTMVEAETSGIMFSIDPTTNDKTKIIIEAIYGLGELIVQGAVTPDHYEVDKKTLQILVKKFELQEHMLVKRGLLNQLVPTAPHKGKLQKITNSQIIELAKIAKHMEHHYYFPQDMEWAIQAGNVYIVQTRPITTLHSPHIKSREHIDKHLPIVLHGAPASPGIATGPVRILTSAKQNSKVKEGDVLVAPQTNPDFVPAMKRAVAIVTEKGGATSHAAIVAREIGIPAVVGTKDALKKLKDDEIITVNGITGQIYKGGHIVAKIQTDQTADSIQTATKVYVNLAQPEFASDIAKRHVDGVGLLRAEFMMAGIGTHPKKMIHEGKKHEYIEELAAGITAFCKTFSPRPVVYRASDLKTNEYRNLIGGKQFEPVEPNPLLGYRGVFRYIHDPEVFALELAAIKQVREKEGFTNLWLMLPFVRNVSELIAVKKMISQAGLYRSATFKLWMMVEIPSNVILLDKFIRVGIDGVSIGSNDLTMLLLGTDRDNSEMATAYDEENDAVLWALEKIITTCHKNKITVSLCGQAANKPSLLEKLISWGITSVSVSPDTITATRMHIADLEKKRIR